MGSSSLPPDGVAVWLSSEDSIPVLRDADITIENLIQWGSNYTFLVRLDVGDGKFLQAIYKPMRGERPLYDFPSGTLYKREYAAYLFSKSLGWPDIPTTLIREGPHGQGSIQLYVEAITDINYFDLLDDHRDELLKYAIFDVITNNADRKAGHCLLDGHGDLWSIDHGLTFHSEFKLRTVMVDFWGAKMSDNLIAKMEDVLDSLESESDLVNQMTELLTDVELGALRQRTESLINLRAIPSLDPYRNVPWPLV